MVLVQKGPFLQLFSLGSIGVGNMVLVQKWAFFKLFLLGNIGLENILYDILERKNSFLGYKNKNFKKSKN